MKQIQTKQIASQSVTIPGSKSISHRMLICSALCHGESRIDNLLESEDILLTKACLENMGAVIRTTNDGGYTVTGFSGTPHPYEEEIYLGNSGTSMRLLAGIAALGRTPYRLTGDKRMRERPMQELLDALTMTSVTAVSATQSGAPPVVIQGGSRKGGQVRLDCSKSSQYLSALLMIAPFFEQGLDIRLDSPPVSSPYIDLTIDIMKKFGIETIQPDRTRYTVNSGQFYKPGCFFVEPDLSNAGYFWAIGAITGKMIFVDHINTHSLQGDLKQIDILENMGCRIQAEDKRIGVAADRLKGVDVDMSDTPDAVPAIAVVASFADGTTRIRNIAHLREKECDRINAVSSQLQKMGITVRQGQDFMEITGGRHRGARIDTFNDHRIAMAFSIPGLLVEGIEIENETCVEKSFPTYWEIFEGLS